MINGRPKLIEARPILNLLGGKKRYEKFVLEGMNENHNEEYFAVEDQRCLGEQGFGDEISRQAGQKEEQASRRPIEAAFKEIARQLDITPDVLRGRDRRWAISTKRTQAVAVLIHEHGYRVSEVAKYLRRDQANISTILSRLSARNGMRRL